LTHQQTSNKTTPQLKDVATHNEMH